MQALEQMISAVGPPLSLATFLDLNGRSVSVCRWQHTGGRFEVKSSDALRVGINLGGAFRGRHIGAGQEIGISGTPGCVGMFAPGASCETEGEGTIDVIEIYVDVRGLGYPARGWPELPPLDCSDETVRAAVMATYVASLTGDEPRYQSAATALQCSVCRYLLSQSQPAPPRHTGGLRPTATRRIEDLIEKRLAGPQDFPIDTRELAAEAGLSFNHFIQAFRKTKSTTPHNYFVNRRHQRAMMLLSNPDLSVADVANLLGFSSPAHFVASFRQKLWVTPGEYRRTAFGIGNPLADRDSSRVK